LKLRTFSYLNLLDLTEPTFRREEKTLLLNFDLGDDVASDTCRSQFFNYSSFNFWGHEVSDGLLSVGGNSVYNARRMVVHKNNFHENRFLFEVHPNVAVSESYNSGRFASNLFKEAQICSINVVDSEFDNFSKSRFDPDLSLYLTCTDPYPNKYYIKPRFGEGLVNVYFDSLFQYNYWHTIIEFTNKAWLFRENGVVPDYIICSPKYQYQVDWLNILFPNSKLAIAPSGSFQIEGDCFFPLRVDRFDPIGLRQVSMIFGAGQPKMRVYISRRGASTRQVHNESEVEGLLKMFGFISVDTSLLSLNEQIRLFSKASVIVSPCGAGWANMVFSPSAKILEIIGLEYYSPTMWLLANVLGHSYFQLITAQQQGKFVVDLNRLRCLLEEVLES